MASHYSTVVSVQELPVQANGMMQAMAAVELYRAQREVANYFELAYLKLGDMPEVAREVRTTANNARTQHLMTAGLMKKFTVSAGHIVCTMIPMILDAVELEDRDIVVDCFAQILDMADNMKKEAEDTQANYHVIQAQVQGNLALLVEKNKKVLDEEKKRAIEMERETELLKAAQLKEQQLEEEKQKLEEELKTLQTYRDQMMEESVNVLQQQGNEKDEEILFDSEIAPDAALEGGMEAVSGVLKAGVNIFKSIIGKKRGKTNRNEEDEETFLDAALGGGVEAVFGILAAGVNIFKSIFGAKTEKKKAKAVKDAFNDSQANVEKMFDKNQEVINRIHQERTNALDRLAKIRELAVAEVGIVNAESLREASAHLGDVDKQFTRIIQFWSHMAAMLKFLKDDTKAGEVYLKKIENPKHAQRFKKSIARSEQRWSNFGRICQDYIVESDNEIGQLYAFLSAPIDQMPAAARKARLQQLMQGIEDDINNAFPQQ